MTDPVKSEYNLITLFQRLVDRLDRIEQKDWFKLQELSQVLLEDFEKGVLSWDSEKGYKRFKLTLERLASEEENAKKRILRYRDELEKRGLDKNDHEYVMARECLAVIEYTISELLVILVYNYPERLKNRPDFRKKILERLQYFPKKERVRQHLLNIAEEEKMVKGRESKINSLSTKEGTLATETLPDRLEDIFKYPKDYQRSIDVLKVISPPLLNKSEEWLGNSKGAICLWIDLLKKEGIIKVFSDKVYANLISSQFNFSIDPSNFRRTHKRAEDTYLHDLRQLVSKLSQNSRL